MPAVTSTRNPLLKEIRRAVSRGSLTADGYCVAETFHLLEEALASACEIAAVVAAESVAATVEEILGAGHRHRAPLTTIPDDLFAGIAATEATQGVLALVRPRAWQLVEVLAAAPPVLVMDGIQDPGNCGAILRAAEAFGAGGALLLKGTASPYNPKAVRATAGSLFRLPHVCGIGVEEAQRGLSEAGFRVFAASADGEEALDEVDLRRAALVIGSEGRGVSPEWFGLAETLRIPVHRVESLNAAVAAGVLLYEARRQRREHL